MNANEKKEFLKLLEAHGFSASGNATPYSLTKEFGTPDGATIEEVTRRDGTGTFNVLKFEMGGKPFSLPFHLGHRPAVQEADLSDVRVGLFTAITDMTDKATGRIVVTKGKKAMKAFVDGIVK